jgi:hypothetical protein
MVDWDVVHTALCQVSSMFQIWACKQVMDIAPANGNCPWECTLCLLCPSCAQVPKTRAHILFCSNEGHVDAMMKSIDLLSSWMVEVDTDTDLYECILEYAKGRGTITMSDICQGMDSWFRRMTRDQDEIYWQRFMEGMVTKGLQEIQMTYSVVDGSNVSPKQWTTGVIIKQLKITHSQWFYWYTQVHDRIQGTQATLQKEELQKEIEAQQEMGYDGLLKEDQYLAEVNLDDLENSSGEQQEYWLVVIPTAWEAGLLQGVSQPNKDHNSLARDGHFITKYFLPCTIRVMGFKQPIIPRHDVLKERSPLMRSGLQRCLVSKPLAYKDSFKGVKGLGSSNNT